MELVPRQHGAGRERERTGNVCMGGLERAASLGSAGACAVDALLGDPGLQQLVLGPWGRDDRACSTGKGWLKARELEAKVATTG